MLKQYLCSTEWPQVVSSITTHFYSPAQVQVAAHKITMLPKHPSRLTVATRCIECVQAENDFLSVFWLYTEEGIPFDCTSPNA